MFGPSKKELLHRIEELQREYECDYRYLRDRQREISDAFFDTRERVGRLEDRIEIPVILATETDYVQVSEEDLSAQKRKELRKKGLHFVGKLSSGDEVWIK